MHQFAKVFILGQCTFVHKRSMLFMTERRNTIRHSQCAAIDFVFGNIVEVTHKTHKSQKWHLTMSLYPRLLHLVIVCMRYLLPAHSVCNKYGIVYGSRPINRIDKRHKWLLDSFEYRVQLCILGILIKPYTSWFEMKCVDFEASKWINFW